MVYLTFAGKILIWNFCRYSSLIVVFGVNGNMYLLRDGCVYVKKSSGDGDNIQYVQYGDGDEEFCFKPSSTYTAQCQEEEEQTQVVPQGDITLLGFDQLANFVIQWTASSPTSAAWTQPTSLIQSLESRRSKAAFWNLSSTMTFPDPGSASWTCPATAPLSLASTRFARAEIKIPWTLERGLFWSPLETLCGTRYPWYQPIMSMTSTIVRVRFRKYSIFFHLSIYRRRRPRFDQLHDKPRQYGRWHARLQWYGKP